MKVYINKYRNHWLSPYTILEKVVFWKDVWEENGETTWVKTWVDRLNPYCVALGKFLDEVNPKIDYVKIDPWDTWAMDHTLSLMIVPMLKQLKATKHGAPTVDDEDVPENLRSTSAPSKENNYDHVDANHFARWDWVLDEMIWGFETYDNDLEAQFYDDTEVNNNDSIDAQARQMKVDEEGLQAYYDRRRNAFLLFGKYYQSLWD